MNERWTDIPGFDNYEASDLGRIRSKTRTRIHKNGHRATHAGRVLIEMIQSGKGYKRVNLYRNKRMSQHGVHCLVALAFLGPPNGMYVNHIDFDVTNNRLSNLEYVTPAGNTQHSAKHGRLKAHHGEMNPMARLSIADIERIAERIRSFDSDKEIASDYGVTRGEISAIRRGKIWKHVTGFDGTTFKLIRGSKQAARMTASGNKLTFIGIEKSTGVARFYLGEFDHD